MVEPRTSFGHWHEHNNESPAVHGHPPLVTQRVVSTVPEIVRELLARGARQLVVHFIAPC